MNVDVVPYLRCPVCADHLTAADGGQGPRSLRCPGAHSFDVARQGYVSLVAGGRPGATGDTAEMVAERERFLAAGHYSFLSTALAAAVGGADGLVVDAGAGTGHHLAAVLDAAPAALGLALDASKPALRRAARAHPRAGAVLCDTWRRLPLADACASVVLNVFAPRNGAEFRRVLRPDGRLLVVTPAPDHLVELVDAFGMLRVDPEKPARMAAALDDGFIAERRSALRSTLGLSRADVLALVGMGPSAWHADRDALAARVPPAVTVTASITISGYRRRPDGN